MVHIGFLGTGSVQPARQVSTQDLAQRWGADADALVTATGVVSRFYAGEETCVSMGVAAAQQALETARVTPSDLDLILSASAIPYQALPATAPLYQRGLGAANVPAFDVNASCLSFLTATDLARAMIQAGRAQRVLVVSSEVASRGLPWHDQPETAALFGDGAAAAVIGPVPAGNGIQAVAMKTYSQAYESCQVQIGGTRHDIHADPESYQRNAWFRMEGQVLYKLTARHIRSFVKDVLAQSGWTLADVDVVIPHQASRGGIDHAIRLLGLRPEQVVDILSTHGNQVAASLPTALHAATVQGRLPSGTRALMVGTSAGVSLGAMTWVVP